jgi:hypothetical protein
MGAPAIFEKQIEIKLLHPASTLESRILDELLAGLVDQAGFVSVFHGPEPDTRAGHRGIGVY